MLGQGLWVAEDSIENCLSTLYDQFGGFQLYSHQEFGNQWTRQRNQRVQQWCQHRGIDWLQFQSHGVVRGLESRVNWRQLWHNYMSSPILPSPTKLEPLAATPLRAELWPSELGYDHTECPLRQRGGRKYGLDQLVSYLKHRGMEYDSQASVPLTSYHVSSRLSPYLNYGVLGHREVFRQVNRAQQHYKNNGQRRWANSMQCFIQQLQEHGHRTQQFDDESEMEQRSLHKSFDGLRENEFNEELFQAWAEARTGFPVIDAAMLALQRHGWINAQLRALLISFACYQLWLHWVEPALHLARWSTDYEPGLHYPLVQWEAGTTGLVPWQVLEPVAQSQALDPSGEFIRTELPMLAELKGDHLHAPWLMSAGEQFMAGCLLGEDYPRPVVDPEQATRLARQRMERWLSDFDDPAETARLQARLGCAERQQELKASSDIGVVRKSAT